MVGEHLQKQHLSKDEPNAVSRWSLEDIGAAFVVKLGYFYYEEEPGGGQRPNC